MVISLREDEAGGYRKDWKEKKERVNDVIMF